MLRRLFLIAALAVPGACTDRGELPALRVWQVLLDRNSGRETEPYEPPTRERLDRIPSALLALRIGESDPAFIAPVAKNGPYLTYLDQGRRGVVLRDGAVSGTVALGYDLKGLKTRADDPVAHRAPLSEWPAVVERVYQFRLRDGEDYIVALTCRLARGPRERIEIFELFYETVRVTETCVNARREVTNTHWVEPETGFIWRSEQWVHPKLPMMTIEIIRPFGEG